MTKFMNVADANLLAEQLAMGEYLSDWGDYTYDEVMEAFWKGEIFNDVILWEVVENDAPEAVANMIEGLRNQFLYFYERVVDKA